MRPFVVTVAGSDPSGGAGIQADIKTMTAMGAEAGAVVAGLTAQSGVSVYASMPVPPDMIAAQCRAIMQDCPPAVVKTGMLTDAATIRAILPFLAFCHKNNIPVVGDPVCVSTSGATLLDEAGRALWVAEALPFYRLITPNAAEVQALSIKHSPCNMLITGGDSAALCDTVTDTLYDAHGRKKRVYQSPRIPGGELCRGTGCALSAAIACRLALGDETEVAIDVARRTVHAMIASAYVPAGGSGRKMLGFTQTHDVQN